MVRCQCGYEVSEQSFRFTDEATETTQALREERNARS
jgi:hypothetical protein